MVHWKSLHVSRNPFSWPSAGAGLPGIIKRVCYSVCYYIFWASENASALSANLPRLHRSSWRFSERRHNHDHTHMYFHLYHIWNEMIMIFYLILFVSISKQFRRCRRKWLRIIIPNFTTELFRMSQPNYSEFHNQIIPNITTELFRMSQSNYSECHNRIIPNVTTELFRMSQPNLVSYV